MATNVRGPSKCDMISYMARPRGTLALRLENKGVIYRDSGIVKSFVISTSMKGGWAASGVRMSSVSLTSVMARQNIGLRYSVVDSA